MKGFIFPIKEMNSRRLHNLAGTLAMNHAEALGIVMLLWHETRVQGLEAATAQEIASLMPLHAGRLNHKASDIVAGLIEVGYLAPSDDGSQLTIIDNAGLKERTAKVVAQCKNAARARIAKATKPVRQTKPRTQALAAVPQPTPTLEANRATWDAYAAAYAQKMNHPPVRNAKANSLIKQFVQRLGAQDAPHVISFFVQHPNPKYMGRLYQLDMAVGDAESLHTQWLNGQALTQSDVRRFDEQRAIDLDRQRILNS